MPWELRGVGSEWRVTLLGLPAGAGGGGWYRLPPTMVSLSDPVPLWQQRCSGSP